MSERCTQQARPPRAELGVLTPLATAKTETLTPKQYQRERLPGVLLHFKEDSFSGNTSDLSAKS
jgi:hypothetical protein